MVEIKKLSKQIGNAEIIKNVSFSFDGKILGVCGDNKTVLLNIISGTIPASDGEVLVYGEEESNGTALEGKDVGYLLLNSPMPNEMTPVEFLTFIGKAKNVSKQKLAKQIDTVLDITGLTESKGVYIARLCAFERKLLGVAQTLLGNPKLILLDEPFANLTKSEKRTMRQLIKTIGDLKTVIVSAANLYEFTDICDKIAYLSEGELLACESLDVLTEIIASAESDDDEEDVSIIVEDVENDQYNNEENTETEKEEDAE